MQAFFRILDSNGDGLVTPADFKIWAKTAGHGLLDLKDLDALFHPDLPSFKGPPQTTLRATTTRVAAGAGPHPPSSSPSYPHGSLDLEPGASSFTNVLAGVGSSLKNVLNFDKLKDHDNMTNTLLEDTCLDDFLDKSDDDEDGKNGALGADAILRQNSLRKKAAASSAAAGEAVAAAQGSSDHQDVDLDEPLNEADYQADEEHMKLVEDALAVSAVPGGIPESVLSAALSRRPLFAAQLVLVQKLARAQEAALVASAAASAALSTAAAAATAAGALNTAILKAEKAQKDELAAAEAAEALELGPHTGMKRRSSFVATSSPKKQQQPAWVLALNRARNEAETAAKRAQRAAADSATAAARAKAEVSGRGSRKDPAVSVSKLPISLSSKQSKHVACVILSRRRKSFCLGALALTYVDLLHVYFFFASRVRQYKLCMLALFL